MSLGQAFQWISIALSIRLTHLTVAYQPLYKRRPNSLKSLQISLHTVHNASVLLASLFIIQQTQPLSVFRALDLFPLPLGHSSPSRVHVPNVELTIVFMATSPISIRYKEL